MSSLLVAMILIMASFWASPASAAEAAIRIEAVPTSFARFSTGAVFGRLEFRGGLVLSSSDKRFGGLSGLAMTADGTGLLAVSDDGWWLKAELQYVEGRPVVLSGATLAPILDAKGRRPGTKRRRDAEALAVDPAGEIDALAYIGFESRTRIEKYDMQKRGLSSRPVRVPAPNGLLAGPYNGQLEALGILTRKPWKGWLIALSEKNLDAAGNIRGWLLRGEKSLAFTITRFQDYDITDLAVLPDGSILTLERSYSPGTLPGMAVRRFSLSGLKKGQVISPRVLFSGRQPFYQIDNMEGIAVHTLDGELRVTVISDDNYDRDAQRTVLFQFALPP